MLQSLKQFSLNLNCRVLGMIIVIHLVLVPAMFAGVFHWISTDYQQFFKQGLKTGVLLLRSELRYVRGQQAVLEMLQAEHARRPLVYADYQSGEGAHIHFVQDDGTLQLTSSAWRAAPQSDVSVVQMAAENPVSEVRSRLTVGYDLRPIMARMRVIVWDALVLVVLYMLFAIVLGYYIRNTLVQPMMALKDAARSVANGDLAANLNVVSPLPEILSLGLSLDHMRNALVEQAAALKREALHDTLTGLPNRGAIQELIEREHSRSVRKNTGYTLILFDLDHFKRVNDNYGHSMGDAVLRAIADVVHSVLRETDVVARWGGEEFLGLLPEVQGEGVIAMAERLRTAIAQNNISLQNHTLSVTISMGLASYPEDGRHWHDLLDSADARLYEAKRSGRNRVVTGKNANDEASSIVAHLEKALQKQQVQAVYQPVMALRTQTCVAYQVYPQICLESGRVICAEHFMLSASQLRIAHNIDAVVMRDVIDRCLACVEQTQTITYLVKVSRDFLRHPEIVTGLLAFAQERCVPDGGRPPIVLELEERDLMADPSEVCQALAPFTQAGIRIALSGFGRGRNSVQYLADLPISFLKLSDGLLAKSQHNARARAILQGLQGTAQTLQMVTIAEGVENQQAVDLLAEIGVDWWQGPFAEA